MSRRLMHLRLMTSSHRARGFTITELMIAMTLGLILISGMLSVFVSTKRTSDLNNAVANLQENARYALDSLTREIRMAGFQGCLNINTNGVNIRTADAPTADFRSTFIGGSVVESANRWVPAPLAAFTIPNGPVTAVPGTHTLSIQSGSANNSNVSDVMSAGGFNSAAGDIPISDNLADLQAGDLAIISDCTAGDLFKVSDAPQGAGFVTHSAMDNFDGNLTKAYGTSDRLISTRLMKFQSNIYFVGNEGETTIKGDPINSLYVQTIPYDDTNPPVAIIEGIENLRVRFGVRQANGSILYVTADQPEYDSTQIQSVQVGILMASYDRIRNDDDTQTYVLAGQQIPSSGSDTAADASEHSENRQYRLAFNTTTNIRNPRRGDN